MFAPVLAGVNLVRTRSPSRPQLFLSQSTHRLETCSIYLLSQSSYLNSSLKTTFLMYTSSPRLPNPLQPRYFALARSDSTNAHHPSSPTRPWAPTTSMAGSMRHCTYPARPKWLSAARPMRLIRIGAVERGPRGARGATSQEEGGARPASTDRDWYAEEGKAAVGEGVSGGEDGVGAADGAAQD